MGPTTVDIYSQPVYLPKELGGTNSDSRTEYSPKIPSFEEMEASVDNCNQFLESTWLPRCDIDNDPRAWLSVIMARIVIIKMRIFIYKPRPGAAMVRTQEIRDKLFTYTLEVIELENLGISEPRVKKWSWYVKLLVIGTTFLDKGNNTDPGISGGFLRCDNGEQWLLFWLNFVFEKALPK